MQHVWISVICVCLFHATSVAARPDKLGVSPDHLDTAQGIVRYLKAENKFEVVPMATSDDGEYELDRLLRIQDQIESENFYSIIGPYDRLVGMVTEKLHVPYLCTWVSEDRVNTFGILPHPEDLWSAFQDVLVKHDWDHIGLLYEDSQDFDILNGFLEKSRTEVEVWRVTKGMTQDGARELLLNMRDRQITNYLLLTTPPLIRRFFRSARKLGMISPSYNWMVPNLVSEDISKNILEDINVSVTAISLLDEAKRSQYDGQLDNIMAAGIFDAIQLLIKIRDKNSDSSGEQVLSDISQVRLDGVTGPIEFDDQRRRVNYKFNITEFKGNKFEKVGEWRALPRGDTRKKLVWMPDIPADDNTTTGIFALKGRVSRVVTILEKPFTMLKEEDEKFTGNDRFEGFAVDLLKIIADNLEFDYELYIVPDGQFGSKKENGEWNGMIGEVLSGNAAMTMAPLSINADRERAIDFTKPFKTRGISVLLKTPESQASYFQFLKPLSTTVWLAILLAVVVTSIVLYMLERYKTKKGRNDEQFRVRESCWFVFGSLVQVGTNISPASVAGRMLTSAWWLFALMMVSTYTANLAAFLTVKKIQPPISTVTDLAGQTKIQFGTVRNSGVESFFKKTKIPAFADMWLLMDETFANTMVNSTKDGMDRVKQGNYAFLWDNTVTSYIAKVDCQVTEIGPAFDPKGFGMGVPPGATYREELSLAILKLGDDGIIAELENKWWAGGNCEDFTKPTADSTSELQLENVAGIFFILFGGFGLSIIIWVMGRLVYRSKLNLSRKDSNYSLPDANVINNANTNTFELHPLERHIDNGHIDNRHSVAV